MMRITGRNFIYYSLSFIQWGAGIAAAVLTFAATQSSTRWNGVWVASSVVYFSHNHKFWIFALSTSVVIAKFSSARMGAPWAWKSIQDTLTRWKKELFPKTPDDEHRITIFKHTSKWCSLYNRSAFKQLRERGSVFRSATWPDGWFRPMARSGEVVQKGISWFPYFDRSGPDGGFIGIVWKNPDGKTLNGLPDIDAPARTPADLRIYSTAAKVPVTWLEGRRDKVNARSFCGIRIELDGASNWGVLIIDSRGETLEVSRSELTLAAVALGKLIKRA